MKNEFLRHFWYERAVQSPFEAIQFIRQEYRKLNRRLPTKLREDFCGTGLLAKAWVKLGPKNSAVGIDHDPVALEYAAQIHVPKLSRSQAKRLKFIQADVRKPPTEKIDIIVALNYSYFLFTERKDLLDYFRQAFRTLAPKGILVLDLFGGSRAQDLRTRTTRYPGFTYYWECVAFNPVKNRGIYSIHLKPDGKKKWSNVFVYDFRLWNCPELIEALKEVGFDQVTPYWEGDKRSGGGDGNFTPTEWEENSRVWRSFLIARRSR